MGGVFGTSCGIPSPSVLAVSALAHTFCTSRQMQQNNASFQCPCLSLYGSSCLIVSSYADPRHKLFEGHFACRVRRDAFSPDYKGIMSLFLRLFSTCFPVRLAPCARCSCLHDALVPVNSTDMFLLVFRHSSMSHLPHCFSSQEPLLALLRTSVPRYKHLWHACPTSSFDIF